MLFISAHIRSSNVNMLINIKFFFFLCRLEDAKMYSLSFIIFSLFIVAVTAEPTTSAPLPPLQPYVIQAAYNEPYVKTVNDTVEFVFLYNETNVSLY